jgi:glycerol-3-phosphate acyltransferase PlsY
VALFDLGKGVLASLGLTVWLSPLLGDLVIDPILLRILAGLAAVTGHIWTIFYRFRGGKGVLTLAGAVIGVAPLHVGICFLIFLVVFLLTRYVSLGSIVGAIVLPMIVLFQKIVLKETVSPYLIGFSFFVTLLIVYTHRANIARLLRGEESKFGKRNPQSA